MTFKEFCAKLENATTEETVKAIYAKQFKINYDTSDKHDLYTPQVLFEFKYDKNFQNRKILATVLAQALYYIRRLKYDETEKNIPFTLCLADKNEAVITETNEWSNYYSSDIYNWLLPPSKPDNKLVEHLLNDSKTTNLHVYKITQKEEYNTFESKLKNALSPQITLNFGDKKVINEENFEAVFEQWKNSIGKHIHNGYKNSEYFLANIQRERITIDRENQEVIFKIEEKRGSIQKILLKEYDYFWSIYDYVNNQETIEAIRTKLDRLTDENQRRFEGEFYTPLIFAKKAIHYIEDVLGKNWYKSTKYRIWDMAAGTGNLEYHLPAEAYKYLYMSTLHLSEAEHLKKVFSGATCFQYDYLNDDVEYILGKNRFSFEPTHKLSAKSRKDLKGESLRKLRKDLKDESLTWLVFINPPFATSQTAGKDDESKKGVSNTIVEKFMDEQKIGHAKRELFAQFMFRITNELPKNTYLGMFSTLKYLNAPDSIEFREKHFNFKYEKGFLFHSKNFQGIKGDFPIGFLLWNLAHKNESDIIKIDITDNIGTNIGVKHLKRIKKENVLNNWFKRPTNSDNFILPPLSNGITVKDNNKDTRHRARKDFLASICSKGNDFQNCKYVVILSSPSVSAGAFTVNAENFEKSLTLHAVKKIPKATWLNDRNQFLIPHTNPSAEFMNDCVIWSLFSLSNETTSLKDVSYLGKTYQIKNHFFPFKIADLKQWEIKNVDFKAQLTREEDRFVANWIESNELSPEAQEVLSKAKELYQFFFSHLNQMITYNWKINTWDAGWFQIRRCLEAHNLGANEIDALKKANDLLSRKILPQIENFGFLDKDEVYEEL